MVFNATFNNILAISWQSGLLVEETSVPGENHRTVSSFITYCSIEYTSVVIGTDYICSCKSNYHTIAATTAPTFYEHDT